MAWIESNQELGRHPKTKKLARLLGISVVTAVGHLHYLWWWTLDFAQDGILDKYDECDIADACLWEGDAKSLIDALVKAGFIDNTEEGYLVIHDWMDYAGRIIEKRQANTERMRKARAKNVQRTCNERAGATVPNRTVPNRTVPNNNNNNAREENSDDVNESPESVTDLNETVNDRPEIANDLAKTVPELEENRPMDLGTQAVNWAEKNWGRTIVKGEADNILAWCDELANRGSPDPDALVIEALRCCLDADARKANYLNAVLRDWDEHGVLTVAQVEARELERKSQKGDKRGNKGPGDKPPDPPKSGKYDNFYL